MTAHLPYLLIGNPEHRRVVEFQAALAAQGRAPARVVAWRDLLRDRRALEDVPNEPMLVRVDSFGQSFEVEKLLLARGLSRAREHGCSTLSARELDALREERGRILAPRQHHLGVEGVLDELEVIFAHKDRWRILAPPASVRELFDKRVTSRRYAALGIPVPRALPEGLASPAALREAMRASETPSVFVKLSCGSSASCLGIFDGASLTTTIELTRSGRMYNTRKVRRYEARREIDGLLAFLCAEGSHVEARVPKARLDGMFFDLRVLVVAGEPAFTIVRQSPREITNLHLGGQRGDLAAYERAVPEAAREAALASARRVFEAHACFHVGVDLMFDEDLAGHRVLEANAFGDLFPGLARDGLSVYEWEIRAADDALT